MMKASQKIPIYEQLAITFLLLSPVLYSLAEIPFKPDQSDTGSITESESPPSPKQLEWQEFSISAYQKALETNRIVLVDFYAEWCGALTMNHQLVTFKDSRVIQEMRDKNVIAMRGNWTHENPEISAFLKSQGYESIPLIVLSSKSTMENPIRYFGPLTKETLLHGIQSLE